MYVKPAPPHQTTVKMPVRASSKHHISIYLSIEQITVIHCHKHFNVHVHSSPEDGSVEVVCMCAVDGVQVAGGGQLGSELAPGHLQDLVGNVSLYHLDKMLHLVSVEL